MQIIFYRIASRRIKSETCFFSMKKINSSKLIIDSATDSTYMVPMITSTFKIWSWIHQIIFPSLIQHIIPMNKQSTNTHTLLKNFNENISGNMRQNVAMTIDKINLKKIQVQIHWFLRMKLTTINWKKEVNKLQNIFRSYEHFRVLKHFKKKSFGCWISVCFFHIILVSIRRN